MESYIDRLLSDTPNTSIGVVSKIEKSGDRYVVKLGSRIFQLPQVPCIPGIKCAFIVKDSTVCSMGNVDSYREWSLTFNSGVAYYESTKVVIPSIKDGSYSVNVPTCLATGATIIVLDTDYATTTLEASVHTYEHLADKILEYVPPCLVEQSADKIEAAMLFALEVLQQR